MKAPDPSDRPTAAAHLGSEATLHWQAQTFLANHDAIIVTDTWGRVLDWNPAAERIFGYTREEMLGQPTATIHRPEDVPTLSQTILGSLARDGSWAGEIVYQRKDGGTGVCETTVSPLRDERGQFVGAFGVNRDITERKRLEAEREAALAEAREARRAAEQARAEAEAERSRLQTLLDVLPVGVGIADARGAAVHINPAYGDLWGLIATLPAGVEEYRAFRGWWPTTGALIQPEEWATARALLAGEEVRDEEVEIETFDGQRKTALTQATPIRDEAGTITGAVVVQQDITARKQLEAEREAALVGAREARQVAEIARQHLRDLFMQAPACICVTRGPEHRVELINDNFRALYGWREFLGKTAREGWPELEGQGFFDLLDQVYATSEPVMANEVYARIDRNNDGVLEDGYFTFVYQPARDANGTVEGVLVFATEVTDQARAREAIQANEAAAQVHAREQDAIFAAVADGVAIYDRVGRLVQWNAALATLFEFERQPEYAALPLEVRPAHIHVRDAHGQPIPPADLPFMRAARGEILTGERAVDLLVTLPSGHDAEVSASAAPLRDESGGVMGAVTIYRDVTARRAVERALRKSEGELAEAQRIGHLGSWYWDARTDASTGSDELMRIYGLDPTCDHLPLFAEQDGRLYPHESWQRINEAVQVAQETGQGYAIDVRAYRNGTPIWVTTRSEVARDADGAIVGLRGTIQDITEHKRTEEALRENQQRLRLAQLAGRIGVFEWLIPQDRVVWSPELEALYGITEGTFEGSFDAWRKRIVPDDAAQVEQDLEAILRERGETYAYEFRIILPDGTRRWTAGQARFDYDAEGRPARMIGVNVDIDERARAEEALRESEEKFRTLADNIPALAWMARPDGDIFWYNQRWYDYTGTTTDSQFGWGWQSVHDPTVLPEVVARWQQSLATGQPFEMVFPLRGADGEFRPFLTRVVPLTDARGTVVRWFGTNTDVTEQRQIAEALRAANVALDAANRVKDEFLGIASHELRTPLTSIGMNVQLANRHLHGLSQTAAVAGDAPLRSRVERAERLLERTEGQLARMNRLVGDLLDGTRIQAGKLDLRPEPCDLLAIVREAVDEQRAARPARTITCALPRHTASLPIVADADRIGQVVTNYLTNALKYSAEDQPVGVRVRVRGGEARIEVSDHGPGLRTDERARVWEQFYRVPGIEQQSGSGIGLGLGLHICQTMIARHGGAVGVESTPGKGSTFWFTLPLATSIDDQALSVQPGAEGAASDGPSIVRP